MNSTVETGDIFSSVGEKKQQQEPRDEDQEEQDQDELILLKPLIDAINEFTFQVYVHKASSTEAPDTTNLVFSPLSLFSALKMCHSCADAESGRELARLLNLNNDARQLDAFIKRTCDNGRSSSSSSSSSRQQVVVDTKLTSCRFATKIYARENYLPAHVAETLSARHGAMLESTLANFEMIFEECEHFTRAELNESRHHMHMALVNSFELDAEWTAPLGHIPYDEAVDDADSAASTLANISDEERALLAHHMKPQTTMMIGYAHEPLGLALDVCELALGDNRKWSLTLLAPHAGRMAELEKQMSQPGFVDSVLDQLRLTQVCPILPKFSVSHTSELRSVLAALGARSLVDFEHRNDGLCLGRVVCKSSLSVDCTTVTARAETVFALSREPIRSSASSSVGCSLPPQSSSQQHLFEPSSPFIFLIRHRATRLVAFIGKMVTQTD